jgi:hypothetical protein
MAEWVRRSPYIFRGLGFDPQPGPGPLFVFTIIIYLFTVECAWTHAQSFFSIMNSWYLKSSTLAHTQQNAVAGGEITVPQRYML